MPLFTGVGVALATLFHEDGTVDAAATAEHAARLTAEGIRAVLVHGSTGEAPALDLAEQVALVSAVRAAVPAGVPVIAGTGAASSRQAIASSCNAVDAGADALLALSPPRARDPRRYYDELAKAVGDTPLYAYHFPGVSAPGVPMEVLPDLPVRGIKDSSGDPERMLRELREFDGELYVGSSAVLAFAGPMGATGALLAVANVAPALAIAAFGGDATAQLDLLPAHVATGEDFPHGLKDAMAAGFGTSVVARMG